MSSNPFGFKLESWRMHDLYHLLWAMFVVAGIGVICFELTHYRFAETNLDAPVGYGDERHEGKLSRLFAGVGPLVKPYFFQKESSAPLYYASALLALGLWDLAMNLIFTLWMKEFWDIIEQKKSELFMGIMRDFVLLASTMIMVGTYRSYVGMMLVIHWRRWTTEWLIGKWMSAKTYYQIQLEQNGAVLDNPDQRIQEDVNIFIPTLLNLVAGLMESIGQLVTMLPLLLLLSPPYAFGVVYLPGWLLYLALLYSGVGTLAAHLIGSKLIIINFAKQKYEADFRYQIVQVRDNAESIALYGSEECERARMDHHFDNIVHVWWLMMMYTKRLAFFTAFYLQTSATFPYLVLAPSYFRGQITLGRMFMLFKALGSVKGAFDWIIHSYGTLTDFRATLDRLQNFHALVDQRAKGPQVTRVFEMPPEQVETALVASDMNVSLPDAVGGRVLWKNAGLVVRRGEFVLLTAPEGSGKSSFFRALAGIWPRASGNVYMQDDALFVPQRSYIPQGTLKQALAYPEREDRFTDEQVKDALQAVGLAAASGRDLRDESNWQLALSGGEQQRLAIAHAVLRRPHVLFLDEATGAMGADGALEIYRLLRRPGTLPQGAAVVSISHDIELLRPAHDTCYAYSADRGAWTEA